MRRVVSHSSRFQRLGASVLSILAVACCSAAAADETAPASKAADVRNGANVGNVDVGPVFSIHSLLGRRVSGADKKPLGVASDLAVDLDDADVAMIAITPTKTSEGSGKTSASRVWLVPGRLLARVANERDAIQLTAALPKGAQLDSVDWRTTADRPWMEKTLGQKDKNPGGEPPVYTKFVWASTLPGTPVTNPKGETLGTISDVALTRHPLHVAYVVLEPAKSEEQVAGSWAIPLAALVVPLTEKSWQLELPADRLAKIPKIDPDHLPQKIDRAWEEYVSVSYGGAVDDGTQPEMRTK